MSPAFRAKGSAESRLGQIARFAALIVVYSVAARLSLQLASINPSASPVWPPTGIAIAALVLLGRRFWPAIMIGAFVVNVATAGTLLTSVGIAVGNTLEGVLGAFVIERLAGGRRAFRKAGSIFRFAFFGAVASTSVSATFGVTSLALGGFASWRDYGSIWVTWWLGDTVGALTVVPLLLLWFTGPRVRWSMARTLEAALLALSMAVVGGIVFGGALPSATNGPLPYLFFPILVWAAYRFGPREAVTVTSGLSAIATWGTLNGIGPFAYGDPNVSLLLLQGFVGITTMVTLVLAAVVWERGQAEDRLRSARDELERKVGERTAELVSFNEGLRAEVAERERTERLLEEAQSLVHIGSWHWDMSPDVVTWSSELYRIFGLEPRSIPLRYESFLERVHPDDRESVDATVRRAVETGEPYVAQHRIVRPDGGARWILGRGSVSRGPGGRSASMSGTAEDVTERKRAEEERQEAALLRVQVEELAKRTREMTILNEMGGLLRVALTLSEAYPVLPPFLADLFPVDSGALYALNDSGDLLEAVARWGHPPPPEDLFGADDCWALRQGQPHWVDGTSISPTCRHLTASTAFGSLCIPIAARGQTLGVLHLRLSRQPVAPADRTIDPRLEYRRRLATTVAEQISLSLANVKLRETLRLQASQDPLTGLFNRRYMEDTLGREFHRADRTGMGLGILMLDLDHFKRVNDEFGHDAGDLVLREVASLLARRVRKGDIVCRFGGEEFVLVLPECSLEGLESLAEQIRKGIHDLPLRHHGRRLPAVTVSVGVALYPDHGDSPGELLRFADVALYRSKEAGRNRITLAGPGAQEGDAAETPSPVPPAGGPAPQNSR